MKTKNLISLKIFIFLFIIFSIKAFACSCAGHSTITESYKIANSVIIGEITDIPSQFGTEPNNVNVKILKSYKGNLKENVSLTPGKTSCDWIFRPNQINQKYLFYIYFDSAAKKYFVMSGCGGSTSLENGTNDISWLNKLPKSLKKNRIAGLIRLKNGEPLANIKVKIVSKTKEFTVKTNKKGLYEVWDIPADTYFVKPQLPDNYKNFDSYCTGNCILNLYLVSRINPQTPDTTNPVKKIPKDPDYSIQLPENNTMGIDFIIKN